MSDVRTIRVFSLSHWGIEWARIALTNGTAKLAMSIRQKGRAAVALGWCARSLFPGVQAISSSALVMETCWRGSGTRGSAFRFDAKEIAPDAKEIAADAAAMAAYRPEIATDVREIETNVVEIDSDRPESASYRGATAADRNEIAINTPEIAANSEEIGLRSQRIYRNAQLISDLRRDQPVMLQTSEVSKTSEVS